MARELETQLTRANEANSVQQAALARLYDDRDAHRKLVKDGGTMLELFSPSSSFSGFQSLTAQRDYQKQGKLVELMRSKVREMEERAHAIEIEKATTLVRSIVN